MYTNINKSHIEILVGISGQNNVLTDTENIEKYGKDETEDLFYAPEVIIKPETTDEVSKIMAFCNSNNICVTPRGAGTGLSGGALPVHGGICLSTERMNKILEIDEHNFQATVEPGVITQVFQERLEAKGLFYPPDPASKGSCFIGGNIAENSGGPKAVKYGVVKDYVLNLEVVLPDGNIIWTGANVLKNSTGYNITQLIVGSEGTLGVVTKIVFRLIPKPKHDVLMLVPFNKLHDACKAVEKIFRSGVTPSGLELMERDAIEYAMAFLNDHSLSLENETNAHLLIELDGNDQNILFNDAETITNSLNEFEHGEILFADNSKQKETLWRLRRCIGEAVKAQSIYKEEDTVVPRAKLPELIIKVKEIGKKYNFKSVCYGHAGDGNLHINILKGNMTDKEWNNQLKDGIKELFEFVYSLNGTISGEHGIGLVQKDYIPIVFNETELELMKGLKKLFDPNMILNPGKIWN